MLSVEDIKVDEDSEGRNWHETSGQLLDGSLMFYQIFHCIVGPCTRVQKQTWRCSKHRCN